MKGKFTTYLLRSAALLLIVTGVLKLVSALGETRFLGMSDPLFWFATNRQVLFVAAVLELAVAAALIRDSNILSSRMLLAWLATSFLVYRTGLWVIGYQRECRCLGQATAWLGISRETGDLFGKALLGYLVGVSYFVLGRQLIRDKWTRQLQRISGRTTLGWLLLLFPSSGSGLAAEPSRRGAVEYEVTGRLTYTTYDLAGETANFQQSYGFFVAVADDQWYIRVTPVAARDAVIPVREFEIGTDGKDYYQVGYFSRDYPKRDSSAVRWKNSANQKSNSANTPDHPTDHANRKSVNTGFGLVINGTLPPGNSSFAAPLWLAYASGSYLNRLEPNQAPKAWVDGRLYAPAEMEADIQRFDGLPALPRHINYRNHGYLFREGADGNVEKVALEAPFDQGFKEATYEVLGERNIGDFAIPSAFVLTRYGPVLGRASNNTQTRRLLTIEGLTLEARVGTSVSNFVPEVKESIAVEDHRLGRNQIKRYILPDGAWPSLTALQKRPPSYSPLRARKSTHILTFVLVMLIGLLAIPLYCIQRKLRNEIQ